MMRYNIIRIKEGREMMDLESVYYIVSIGYILWKWYMEYDENQKKRPIGKPSKQRAKKRFKR